MDTERSEQASKPLLVPENRHGGGSNGEDALFQLISSSSSASAASASAATPTLMISNLVAACGSYGFGTAMGYSSPAESGIMEELGLSSAQYSVFGSMLTIGAMFGAIFSGRITDLIGRRGAMCVSEVFCIIGWLAIVLAKGVWWLDIGRVLVGCGIGLLSYAVPVYIAEITPKNIRGGFMSFNEFVISCGASLAYLIGSLTNWRTFALIGSIPCFIHLVGLFFVPESPRWLEMVGREMEFEATLKRLRGSNADISKEAAYIKEYTYYFKRVSRDGILGLFQWKYARSITVGVGLMAFQQLGGLRGVTFYATSIFETAGFSSRVGTISAAIVKITMAGLCVPLMDKSGRRPLLLVSAAGACFGCFLMALSFLLQDVQLWKAFTPTLVLIGVLVYIGSYELGMGSIPRIIMAEIFPINIKGSAGSVVNFVSWFGSWVVSYSFIYLFGWSSTGTFFIFCGICGSSLLFIAKLVPETKGKTLEAIQASITHNVQQPTPCIV